MRDVGMVSPLVTLDRDQLARRFALGLDEFMASPLYQRLSLAVAGDAELLSIAAACRAGQQPRNLFLAAVHYLLLGGVEHELAGYYRSLTGAPRDSEGVAPVFRRFCLEHRQALLDLVSTRLVQTNAVKRSAALRLGLAIVARRQSEPVHFLEVGCSAGIHLRFDEYQYEIGGRSFGNPAADLRIDCEWRSLSPPPDLDALPLILSRVGIDLNPIDPSSQDERRWLHALVWPENRGEADLLDRALDVVAARPPDVIAGDALEVCPRLDRDLPDGEPLVVFHAATRFHVPQPLRTRFDATIAALGERRPLYRLSLEGPLHPEPRLAPLAPVHVLALREIRGGLKSAEHLAIVDGHAHWIEPIDR